MIFVYKKWEEFCKKLFESKIQSIPACDVISANTPYLVLKHDVETDVVKAYKLACIEYKYGHRGSYYVQAYLLNKQNNINVLKKMQDMGHEISYHYDVMDSCKGNITAAMEEFEKNKVLFNDNGFVIKTVCQHGNPIIERIGYTSNRDFFRNPSVLERYPMISDIMVNFKSFAKTDYIYYSDVGRKFQMIYDPINNDIENSDEKNIIYEDLNSILNNTNIVSENTIISTHPHRWTGSAYVYKFNSVVFKILRTTAKFFEKIPFIRKFMSKYYYLAKKF